MPKVRLEYYGVEGTGRTVTEAKKDAGRKIEKSLAGDYRPEIVAWRGYVMLVFRKPEGWCDITVADPDGPREGALYAHPNHETREEAILAAQAHVAQCGWRPEDGVEPPEFLTDRRLRSDYRSSAAFQLRYREARAKGLSDNDCHAYAGNDPRRPELKALVEGAQPCTTS